jgi:hypothetical protein
MSKCPRCGAVQERESGCNHITCGKSTHTLSQSKGCLKEYCFVCGRDWAGHNDPFVCTNPPPDKNDKFAAAWSNVIAMRNAQLSMFLIKQI